MHIFIYININIILLYLYRYTLHKLILWDPRCNSGHRDRDRGRETREGGQDGRSRIRGVRINGGRWRKREKKRERKRES